MALVTAGSITASTLAGKKRGLPPQRKPQVVKNKKP